MAGAWVGSALEYYDSFIYATAASLVFPQLFLPSSDSAVAIAASLATYGVGYIARPVAPSSEMAHRLVERHAVVAPAQRLGQPRAGGRDRWETNLGEHSGSTDVPRVRHDEALAVV